MNSRTTITLITALATLSAISHTASSEGQGVFELRLRNFENRVQKDSSGNCCRGLQTPEGRCTGTCDIKFRVCLKHYQATIDYSSSNLCTFGEYYTPVMSNNIANYDVIAFPLDFKWPGTFSLIIEAWHENNKTSGALISQTAVQERLEAGQSWTSRSAHETHTLLEFDYRLVCSAHYYGGDCDTLCRPRDDQFGHYTCGADGDKVCLEGWQKDTSKKAGEGDYCTKAVCLAGCHPEHGECDRPGQCRCKTGWSGPNCDKCQLYPGCVHGSCEKPYECRCDEGWGGLFCNQDLNYCTNHKPCHNGATCRNTGQGSYTCSCPPGYTGTNCESRISNECDHQICRNGGTCQGSGLNDYSCVCPLGFHGRHCEMRAATCADSPCKNGASCYGTRNGGYQCHCPAEFQGVNCDVKIDHCRATPCQNGGTCSLDAHGGDGYQCRCPSGFTGRNCEVNIDDCAANPCQNGGTCFDFVNDYQCYCHAGFIGRNCEENVDDCSTNPCANGGTCHDAINDFMCTCRPGFTGKDCSVEVNECTDSPCLHGFCMDKLNDFECKCLPGYSGKHCNILPDGTVLKMVRHSAEDEELSGNQMVLVGTFSTLIPLVVILAVIFLWCTKQRRKREQRRADAEARKENELNAVNCMNKSKMLEDHMIVNPLDYPSKSPNKCVNTNPNLADEGLFRAKENSYAHKISPKSNFSSRMLCDKLDNTSVAASASSSSYVDRPRLSNLPGAGRGYGGGGECSSASTVSSGASSVCSSDSNSRHYQNIASISGGHQRSPNKKEYNLPTAASINAAAANSKAGSVVGGSSVYSSDSCASRKYPDDMFATEV